MDEWQLEWANEWLTEWLNEMGKEMVVVVLSTFVLNYS